MNKIKITMFKDFTITYDDQEIVCNKITTKKMCGLLQMLVYNKNGITKEELIDELWQDALDPLNSLKYSIFRLRSLLNEMDCFHGKNMITTMKNGYAFALDYIVESDYEKIEAYNIIIQDKHTSENDRFSYAEKLLNLYKGPFYVNGSDGWSLQLRIYYTEMFEKAFTIVCDKFVKERKWNELIPIILQTIKVVRFYDIAYEVYLYVLIKTKEYGKATLLYRYVSELYERELGQCVSKRFKDLYLSIANQEEDVVDLTILKDNLNSGLQKSSALYCDYETFQYIYHFCLKNTLREKKNVYLLIFTLKTKDTTKKHEYYMIKLKKILCEYLRGGDVISRINQTQMIALLSCKTIDNGYAIIQRITSKYYKVSSKEKCRIHYYISSIVDLNENHGKIASSMRL